MQSYRSFSIFSAIRIIDETIRVVKKKILVATRERRRSVRAVAQTCNSFIIFKKKRTTLYRLLYRWLLPWRKDRRFAWRVIKKNFVGQSLDFVLTWHAICKRLRCIITIVIFHTAQKCIAVRANRVLFRPDLFKITLTWNFLISISILAFDQTFSTD